MIFLLSNTIINAPNAPTPAASVAVKTPEYIPPITITNKDIIPKTPFNDFIFFANDKEGCVLNELLFFNTEIFTAII